MNVPNHHEFNELKHMIFALFYETSDLLLKCEDAAYVGCGLSQQQFLVLMAIETSGTPLVKITDVARRLRRNSSSISMIVDRMAESGLVERVRGLPDQRSVHLSLTEKGKVKLEQASKIGYDLIGRLTSCFSSEDIETFAHLVGKLREKAFMELNPGEFIEDIEKPNMKVAKRLLHDR